MADSTAVEQASHLSEIGFPEFTTKLVTDVFNSLIAANIRQTESYIELLEEVGKSLTQYINDTKDDISGEEIMQFLSRISPPGDDDSDKEEASKVVVGGKLTTAEATSLTEALTIDGSDLNKDAITSGDITKPKFEKILDAVANRIAANKYSLLQEMIKQGLLRLVVENGVIETKLTFSTYSFSNRKAKAKTYNRSKFATKTKLGTGRISSLYFKASNSTSYSNVNVSTAELSHQDKSGTRVNIFGRVQLNFKTDYLPLSE